MINEGIALIARNERNSLIILPLPWPSLEYATATILHFDT